jgi:hypothetical protein
VRLLVALMAALALVCLAPATVLADANPNNNGHHYHYGWYKHKTPPPPAPVPIPVPVPATTGGGTHQAPHGAPGAGASNLNAAAPPAAQPPPVDAPVGSLVQQPTGSIITAAQPLPSPQNVWLVAILTAFAAAAAVSAAVWATGRSGHLALSRALAAVAITR